VRKLSRPVPVYAVHIKARFRTQVIEELHALGLPNVYVGRSDQAYSF
jgi:hypothetical protein